MRKRAKQRAANLRETVTRAAEGQKRSLLAAIGRMSTSSETDTFDVSTWGTAVGESVEVVNSVALEAMTRGRRMYGFLAESAMVVVIVVLAVCTLAIADGSVLGLVAVLAFAAVLAIVGYVLARITIGRVLPGFVRTLLAFLLAGVGLSVTTAWLLFGWTLPIPFDDGVAIAVALVFAPLVVVVLDLDERWATARVEHALTHRAPLGLMMVLLTEAAIVASGHADDDPAGAEPVGVDLERTPDVTESVLEEYRRRWTAPGFVDGTLALAAQLASAAIRQRIGPSLGRGSIDDHLLQLRATRMRTFLMGCRWGMASVRDEPEFAERARLLVVGAASAAAVDRWDYFRQAPAVADWSAPARSSSRLGVRELIEGVLLVLVAVGVFALSPGTVWQRTLVAVPTLLAGLGAFRVIRRSESSAAESLLKVLPQPVVPSSRP